jgi:hypothetical protein
MYSLPKGRSTYRHQAGTCYCSCSNSWMGSSCSKNETEQSGYRVYAEGRRMWTVPKMEIYCWWEPHVLKLLDIMELTCFEDCHCESADGRSNMAQVVLPQSTVNDVPTKLYGGHSGEHLGVIRILEKFWKWYYWLQARTCWEVVLAVWPVQSVTIPKPRIGAKFISTSGPPAKG